MYWIIGGAILYGIIDAAKNDTDTSTHKVEAGSLLGTAMIIASVGYVLHQGVKLIK